MAIITGYIDWNTGKSNQHFTFRVNNKSDALNCIKRLHSKSHSIRAAWYFDSKRMLSSTLIYQRPKKQTTNQHLS